MTRGLALALAAVVSLAGCCSPDLVLVSETGEPVAGALVTCDRAYGDASARSDADGEVCFWPWDFEAMHGVQIKAPGFEPARWSRWSSKNPGQRPVRVTLERARTE